MDAGTSGAGAAGGARAGRVRKPPRPMPVRDGAFEHLDLEALRAFRSALQAEEDKVSYWRRILQARLDTVRAAAQDGTPVRDQAHLRPVLTDQRVRSGRSALVQVLQTDDIPPLPSLTGLWQRSVPDGDPQALAALQAELEVAEEQLSTYRAALHRRLGEATGELIARYREQPGLCLSALPLGRERQAVGA